MELLLTKLHKIQNEYGYIPEENIKILATEMNISNSELYGIISFYSRFYTKPVGKYVIRVCKSVSCGINGSKEIIEEIENNLNMKFGESNEDYTLELVECLGHCGEGPVLTINDEFYTNMDKEKTSLLIKNLKNQRRVTEEIEYRRENKN
ncbi:MAG: NADH-quinone oxidoreductase subunit [Fusobacteriaceae bacterium]|nr:NADH-quinone oxidoreductase, subunit [Fusobacteriales bacterium]MDN5304767.1 NADH-quinone oxidoreductase subunit [Fusobacteriaceae bacterium]